MASPTPPDDPLAREYESLARKLRAAKGFCFLVYFVEDQRASQYVRRRLREELPETASELTEIAVDDATLLVDVTLAELFERARLLADTTTRRSVYWIEAFREPGSPTWQAARAELLMRMNERRSRLESELDAPLVLLLPAGSTRETAMLAPDLWHIRLHSAVLGVQGSVQGSAQEPGEARGARDESERQVATPLSALNDLGSGSAAGALEDGMPRAVRYWNQLAAPLRAHGHDDAVLDGVALSDGALAVEAWLDAEEPEQALALAGEVLALAQRRRERAASGAAMGTQDAADEVRVLVHAGDAARQLGDFDAAIEYFSSAGQRLAVSGVATGLAVQVATRLGEALLYVGRHDEAIETFTQALAIAAKQEDATPLVGTVLNWLGQTYYVSDRPQAALPFHRQAGTLWRAWLANDPAAPAGLRGLALSLSGAGDAERELGMGEAARTNYEESLSIARRLLENAPQDPHALRDLSIALNRVAAADVEIADYDVALLHAEEALRLNRELVRRHPTSGTALRDLTISMERVGDVLRRLGRPLAAIDIYQEDLLLSRQLSERAGESPAALRDVALTLGRLGNAQVEAEAWDDARVSFDEKLSISRRLRALSGDTAETLGDLANALLNLVRLPELALPERIAAAREAVGCCEGLVALAPEAARYQDLKQAATDLLGELTGPDLSENPDPTSSHGQANP